MIDIEGVHILMTYQCNYECEHCFVWGSPNQCGTLTLEQIQQVLQQADRMGSVEWIYFEGGEPFLYYAALTEGVRMASRLGFKVGIVSNGYWATDLRDAVESLRPFKGIVQDLSISSDLYHGYEKFTRDARIARSAAGQLGIPFNIISIEGPDAAGRRPATGQIPSGESSVMYRGRAAGALAARVPRTPWRELKECPYENLRDPGRVHVDPFGNVQNCQGISLGNLFREPLKDICERFDPDSHPIVGPLVNGGPAELARRFDVECSDGYADACHLCYEARRSLRDRFPETLNPDQAYGVASGS